MNTDKEKKNRRKIADFIRLVVLLVALSVLLYPSVSSYLNVKNGTKVVSLYDEDVMKLKEEEKKRLVREARAYNQELLQNPDLQTYFEQKKSLEERYKSILNVNGDGIMGYVEIPVIEVKLPVYHGVEESVLQVAVGHFPGTSFPVGGKGSHAVLTGHRGLPTKKLFTDLNKLMEGDVFYLQILGYTLAYEVDQILTVKPEETEPLHIDPDQDQVTLVTCTPYAINTHRLLVRGHRIPYEAAKEIEAQTEPRRELQIYEIVFLAGVLAIVLILFIAWFLGKKAERKDRVNK